MKARVPFNSPSIRRRERLAREIPRAARLRDHVVRDPDPAEGPERLHALPVDGAAMLAGPGTLEQRVDEVDAGLDRHREPGLELARQAQVRVALRLLARAACGP